MIKPADIEMMVLNNLGLNPFLLFILGTIMLYYGSDLLIDNSKLLANKINVSPIIIGITVIAFGTSLPELFISLKAAFQNHGGLVVGNIIGSNVSNICLVLGLVLIVFKFQIKNIINAKLSFIYLSIVSVIFYYFIYSGHLNMVNGLVLLVCFIVYIYVIIRYFSFKSEPAQYKEKTSIIKLLFFILSGSFLLFIGSDFFIGGAIGIATKIGVSYSIIGLTLVALGTSIPELFVSINSAMKKEFDFVIGNVIGSNIINIALVGGITSYLNLIVFTEDDFKIVNPLSLSLSFLMIFLFLEKHLINRFLGAIFIIIYLTFLYINFS